MRSTRTDKLIEDLAAARGIAPDEVAPGDHDALARIVAQAEAQGILCLPLGASGCVVLAPDRRRRSPDLRRQ
jgi:hypothetical protein